MDQSTIWCPEHLASSIAPESNHHGYPTRGPDPCLPTLVSESTNSECVAAGRDCPSSEMQASECISAPCSHFSFSYG